MVQVVGGDLEVVNIESAFNKIMIADRGSELIERYRKISVLHLPGECFAQRLVETLWPVNVPLASRCKERSKKGDALDMIPMRVVIRICPCKPLMPADIKFWPSANGCARAA